MNKNVSINSMVDEHGQQGHIPAFHDKNPF